MKRKRPIGKHRIIKRCNVYDSELFEIMKKLLFNYDKRINPKSIKGYVVKQNRGHAYHFQSEFTVPEWAYVKGKEYFTYYIAHELSHIIAWRKFHNDGHDKNFYEVFKRICPKEIQ